jgi:hypothetical protein
VDNVRLACKVHNRHEAERFFGTHYTEHRRTETGIPNERPACSGATKKLPPVDAPRACGPHPPIFRLTGQEENDPLPSD